MMTKIITEITVEDLNRSPVWYFPMDESLEDGDLIIKPISELTEPHDNYQVIVKTFFKDFLGKKFVGFIYWYPGGDVSDYQPSVFLDNGQMVNFWFGISVPNFTDAVSIKKLKFPLFYRSEDVLGLPPIDGELEGLYYLDSDFKIKVLRG